MKNRKMFLKYLWRYLVTVGIVLIASCFVVMYSYRITARNVMEENTWKLKSGVDNLENQLLRMGDMTETLRSTESLNHLRTVNGALQNKDYVYLNYLEEQLSYLDILYEFATMEFLLFRNNECYVSDTHSADSFLQYYGKFFQYDNLEAEAFKELIFSQKSKISLLPCSNLKYYKYSVREISNPLLCVVYPSLGSQKGIIDDSVAVIYVIEQDRIMDMLFQQKAKTEVTLEIFDSEGKTVYRNPAPAPGMESYQLLEYEGAERMLSVEAGYSKSYLNRYILELVGILLVYLILGLTAAVLLSLFFAGRQYRNMQGLLLDVMQQNEKEVLFAKNEYELLGKSFTQMVQTREKYKTKVSLLENQMKNSVLENAFLQGIYTEEKKQKFLQIFPEAIEYYCVAVLQMNTDDSEQIPVISMNTGEYLQKIMGEKRKFLNVLSGGCQEIYLILLEPEDDSNVEKIRKMFEDMEEAFTQKYDITFCAGISTIGRSLENIHICYRQALQTVQTFESEYTNIAATYYMVERQTANRTPVDLDFMTKLNNLVLCAESESVESLFDHFLKEYRRNRHLFEVKKEESFYAIRNVETGLLEQQLFAGSGIVLPEYRVEQHFEDLINGLRDSALKMCDTVREKKKSKNEELKNSVIEYLESHFQDVNLTALKMSRDIGISEKYLFSFIREQTGYTFAACLENIRMKYAGELLVTTQLSNAEIAQQSGFGSVNTFYRVFSKVNGISPGKYRENFKM